MEGKEKVFRKSQSVSDALRATTSDASSSALADLLRRVEEADGPDAALSNAVCIAAGVAWTERRDEAGFRGDYMRGWFPDVTASLDAALGLVERVLPGWVGEVHWAANGHAYAALAPKHWRYNRGQEPEDFGGSTAAAPTRPLALIAAMLRALPTPSAGDE